MQATPFTPTALAQAIAQGQLSAEEVAEDLLRRCQANSHLHALITQDPARLLAEAGLYPSLVAPARSSLEQVFLGMTGDGS